MSYSIGTIIKQHQPESLAPLFLSLSFAVVNFSPVLYLYMNIQWYLQWGEGDVLELKQYRYRKRADREEFGGIITYVLGIVLKPCVDSICDII